MATASRLDTRTWISGRAVARILEIRRDNALEMIHAGKFTRRIGAGRRHALVLRSEVEQLAAASIIPPTEREV